jgi:hypothetical protein
VITKPRERGGHIPRWAAEPEKIIIIIIIINGREKGKSLNGFRDRSLKIHRRSYKEREEKNPSS